MNEARNYQGRVRETYRITAKSDQSIESIVSAASSSSSNSDRSAEVSPVSSSRVSEEHEFYNLVNSKSLLTNDELLTMLSKDPHFIQNCKDKNISDDDRKLLKNNFDQYLKQYTELTEAELDHIAKKKQLIVDAKNNPKDDSHFAQIKMTGLAGASAYWTSFMVGKLATNIVTTTTGSSHGVWPSLLIAGLLNPLFSEPVANAIRLQGAHHASPDGKAYMDFHSALKELRLAEENNQAERINECHEFIFKIIDECIGREKLMGCLQSGVNEIRNEDINDLNNKYGNIQQVIRSAQLRAFITDELPFFWYTLSYTAPGFFSPIIKQSFSPWIAVGIDFAMHASAGTIAGGLTGISQNYLRKLIQKSSLQNFNVDIKGAQLALAAAQRDPWSEKQINLNKLLAVLEMEKDNLQTQSEQDSEDDRLEALNTLIKKLKIKSKDAESKWKQARAVHSQHESRFNRIKNAVLESGKSYMGEVVNKDKPNLLEGVPAQASMCAKLIAVPLSLVANCAYISSIIPALLSSGYANSTNFQTMNLTGLGDIGLNHSSSLLDPSAGINSGANTAYASVGLPLIAGFVLRYQLFHPLLQSLIRPLFGPVGAETDSEKNVENDTVVNMQNKFADCEDESENDEDVAQSPTTRREINKLNAFNKKNSTSNNRNIDGRSSEDSDSFESSLTQSSFV
jgi:hypothetical protein